jgi:hypothetical protein
VADEDHSTPVMRIPDPKHQIAGGWGLHHGDTLADGWGINTRDHQTFVWFEHWLP